MAEPNISLLGATYSGVKGVTLPKSGGGTATFPWVEGSETKTANGTYDVTNLAELVVNVSGGGGSTALKNGVIRPDATLVRTWAADRRFVQDDAGTIPAYTTSTKTLIASAALTPTETLDLSTYDYYILERFLTIPIYNTATKSKGRPDYSAASSIYEILVLPPDIMESLDGSTSYSKRSDAIAALASMHRMPYWASATELRLLASSDYGVSQRVEVPSLNEQTQVLAVTSPRLTIRGNATYLASAVWSTMTDIRYQYKIELWRSKKGDLNLDGWGHFMQLVHIFDDVKTNSGTLT